MLFLLFLMWAAFGLVFVLGKFLLSHFFYLDYLALRMAFAGAVFFLIALTKGELKKITSLSFKSDVIFLLGLTSICHIFLPFYCEYWATQYLEASKVALLYSFSPFVSAILAMLINNEKFGLQKKLGLFFGFCGLIFPFLNKLLAFTVFGWAQASVLVAVITSSAAWVMIERLERNGVSVVVINAASMILSSVGFFCFRVIFYSDIKVMFPELANFQAWGAFFGILIFSNFLGYPLYSYLLKFYSATLLSLSGFLCPFFAEIFGYIFFGSFSFDGSFLLSISLGSFGLWLFQAAK